MQAKINQTTWDAFVLQYGPRSGRFLQSWGWGEFQKAVGHVVERCVMEKSGSVQAVGQVVQTTVPLLGTYGSIGRGPVVKEGDRQPVLERCMNRHLFLRVDGTEGRVSGTYRIYPTHDVSPKNTLLTDLMLSEEMLLERMHQKTRYNIGLASKKGVHVQSREVSLDEVWSLFAQTAARGVFRLHPRDYYKSMLSVLGHASPDVFLAVAFFDRTPIAANIMLDFGDTRTYLHGASSQEHRSLMAPYLLHWELMRDAKQKGLSWYDWWGVCPRDAVRHPWEGISRFKRGFGGEEVAYPGTYDLVARPMVYRLYQLARKVRRMV